MVCLGNLFFQRGSFRPEADRAIVYKFTARLVREPGSLPASSPIQSDAGIALSVLLQL